MYFPYLRGQQHELLAIRNLAHVLNATNLVLPIIEPVKSDLEPLMRAVGAAVDHRFKMIVIWNPITGSESASIDRNNLAGLIKGHKSYIIPGLIIVRSTGVDEVKGFTKNFQSQSIALIHEGENSNLEALLAELNDKCKVTYNIVTGNVSPSYIRNNAPMGLVKIWDEFNKRDANSEYEEEEHFTENHLNLPEGHVGYGDYTTVSKRFEEGGGKSKAVALHITYTTEDSIRILHFVSDESYEKDGSDIQYSDALEKMIEYYNSWKGKALLNSHGLRSFKSSHANDSFEGLGKAKEYSISHHIELMLSVYK